MKDFFRSTRFKILVGVAVLLFAFMLRAAMTPGFATWTSQVLSAITQPLQKLSSSISDAATDFFGKFTLADELSKENEALKEENRQLKEQLVDYDKIKHENEQNKQYLDLKEENKDFQFEQATVIGRDPNDRFGSFTIDKGLLDDVQPNDPVITPDGLIGRVSEVGQTSAKVLTILDPSVSVGCSDSTSQDTGIVTGTIDLAADGLCQMMYLSRESTAKAGDLVITTGVGGVFPKNLIVGTITEVKPDQHGTSLNAIIEPEADILNVKDVFVIKSFQGQGSDPDSDTSTSSTSSDSSDEAQ